MLPFFSPFFRRTFSIQKASPHSSALYPRQTTSHIQDGPRTHLHDAGTHSAVNPQRPKFVCYHSSHFPFDSPSASRRPHHAWVCHSLGRPCYIPWPRTASIIKLHTVWQAWQEQHPAGGLGCAWDGMTWMTFWAWILRWRWGSADGNGNVGHVWSPSRNAGRRWHVGGWPQRKW